MAEDRSHGLVTSHVTVPLSKGRSYRSGNCADVGSETAHSNPGSCAACDSDQVLFDLTPTRSRSLSGQVRSGQVYYSAEVQDHEGHTAAYPTRNNNE